LDAANNVTNKNDKYELAQEGVAQNGTLTMSRCRQFVDGRPCKYEGRASGCMFAHT
jgi:hypothetical protein